MADLAKIKPSEQTIEIKHPSTGENYGVSVTVMSINDERMKPIKRRVTDKRLSLEAKGKHFKAEEQERNGVDFLFATMLGWNWGVDPNGEQNTFNGEVPEFNRKNVGEVFEELPWFKDQIDEALGDTKAFF